MGLLAVRRGCVLRSTIVSTWVTMFGRRCGVPNLIQETVINAPLVIGVISDPNNTMAAAEGGGGPCWGPAALILLCLDS